MTLDFIFSSTFLGNAVFQKPGYSSLTFDFDKDATIVGAAVGSKLNANNPDLKSFKAHGGKMLHYHGWYDGSPSPLASVAYYRSVIARMGGLESTQDFYRLYIVSGMMRCGTGPGPNSFGNPTDTSGTMDPRHNIFSAPRDWVEAGKVPATVVATKYPGDDSTKPPSMTRPLCPFFKWPFVTAKGTPLPPAALAVALPPIRLTGASNSPVLALA